MVGTGANAEVVGEIDPANCAGGVDEELSGSRYVVTANPGPLVEDIVAADCFRIEIRKKRVGVVRFAAEVLRLSWRIDADGYGLDA